MLATKETLLRDLKTLCDLPGPSGREEKVAAHLVREIEKLGLSYTVDSLGNVITSIGKKEKPRLLICGHMDEVGFLVLKVGKTGLIEAKPVGGVMMDALPNVRVKLVTRKNKVLHGCINGVPPHLANETMNASLTFDFGFSSQKDATKAGVAIQDIIVFDEPFVKLDGGKRFLAKAIDDRYGCCLGLNILKEYVNKQEQLNCHLSIAFSVQEEVGTRGIAPIVRQAKPDICFIVDASPARDGFSGKSVEGELDKGVLIRYLDRGQIFYRPLLEWQMKKCEELEIPYQMYYSPGGTDSVVVHKELSGVYSLVHGICLRNIHSASGLASSTDLFNAYKVLNLMVRSVDEDFLLFLKSGGM